MNLHCNYQTCPDMHAEEATSLMQACLRGLTSCANHQKAWHVIQARTICQSLCRCRHHGKTWGLPWHPARSKPTDGGPYHKRPLAVKAEPVQQPLRHIGRLRCDTETIERCQHVVLAYREARWHDKLQQLVDESPI